MSLTDHPDDEDHLTEDSINSEQADTQSADAVLEQRPALSVVMPTLNEEEGIAECIEQIKAAFETLEIEGEIIVSDSSTDRTPEIAREHGAIVIEPDEEGYGAAYQAAFDHATGKYIAMGDADTTYDFTELPKLYRQVANDDADMAMGSRLEGEIKPGAMPKLHQYVGNPLLTRFLNLFYDADVSDAHSGMRVFSREALETMRLETTGMEFASEMIMEAGARDLTIAEEPITYHERTGEATLDSFQDGWRHVRFMLLNAPGYLFSVPGLVLGALGLVIMAIAGSGLSLGALSLGPHSMIAGSLMTIVGMQIASLGVFATVGSDPIRKPSDPVTEFITDRIQLEHGATAGLLLFGGGGAYAALLLGQWVGSGFAEIPLVISDILAFTAIVLGVQLFFNSFFLSALSSNGQR